MVSTPSSTRTCTMISAPLMDWPARGCGAAVGVVGVGIGATVLFTADSSKLRVCVCAGGGLGRQYAVWRGLVALQTRLTVVVAASPSRRHRADPLSCRLQA